MWYSITLNKKMAVASEVMASLVSRLEMVHAGEKWRTFHISVGFFNELWLTKKTKKRIDILVARLLD